MTFWFALTHLVLKYPFLDPKQMAPNCFYSLIAVTQLDWLEVIH